jgi:hypothetical protein
MKTIIKHARCSVLKKVLAAATVLSLSAGALAQVYEPASFGKAEARIVQSLPAPELTDALPVIGVYCQAEVASDGAVDGVRCYEKEGYDQLLQQTERAVRGETFVPAKVDGSPVPVRMHFRVVYAQLEDQAPVVMLPNLGNMQSRYGFDYTAPQERLDQPQWYEKYRDNSWAEGELFFSDHGRLTRILAIVGTDGTPLAVRRIEAHGQRKRDAVEVEKHLRQARFIPGFADGQPQRMQYAAVLHYPQ